MASLHENRSRGMNAASDGLCSPGVGPHFQELLVRCASSLELPAISHRCRERFRNAPGNVDDGCASLPTQVDGVGEGSGENAGAGSDRKPTKNVSGKGAPRHAEKGS